MGPPQGKPGPGEKPGTLRRSPRTSVAGASSTTSPGKKRGHDNTDSGPSSPPKRPRKSPGSSPSKALKALNLSSPKNRPKPLSYSKVAAKPIPPKVNPDPPDQDADDASANFEMPRLPSDQVAIGNIVIMRTYERYDPLLGHEADARYMQRYTRQLNDSRKTTIHTKVRKFVIIMVAGDSHFVALPIYSHDGVVKPSDYHAEIIDVFHRDWMHDLEGNLHWRFLHGPICRGRLEPDKNIRRTDDKGGTIEGGKGLWLVASRRSNYPACMRLSSVIELNRPSTFFFHQPGKLVGKLETGHQTSKLQQWFIETMVDDAMGLSTVNKYRKMAHPQKPTYDLVKALQKELKDKPRDCPVCGAPMSEHWEKQKC